MTTTPNVTLRAATEADLDMLFAISSDLPTWEERNPHSPAPVTRAAWDARGTLALNADPEESLHFVIDVDGEGVGSVSLFDIDRLARHAEVGISLAPGFRGRGIGTAAIGLFAEFAFERRNLRRLHLQAIASNAGAIRAYERAGFVIEGRRREHAWVRGHYEDIVVMGLLRTEWRAAR
ncbi:GNAT family protein [Schumannella luteola]|uniref:RimJ/RimL family protein N-acetyltransferase n=1 Tax=Schumannella luteola TaxID=472059 RepID=A0A852YML1_9MICO|nr:RimJ/RimL family protein N-acetyltransferase [Schumannella luteola]TPX01309.1 GNAT family N-acetyltransferase [Schumannella luteola]